MKLKVKALEAVVLSEQAVIAQLRETRSHGDILKVLGQQWTPVRDSGELIGAIRQARARVVANDIYRIETACAALLSTRTLLDRLNGTEPRLGSPTISRSQWLFYFSCEMTRLSPYMPSRKAIWMASGVYEHAFATPPELAAISMAIGTSLVLLQ